MEATAKNTKSSKDHRTSPQRHRMHRDLLMGTTLGIPLFSPQFKKNQKGFSAPFSVPLCLCGVVAVVLRSFVGFAVASGWTLFDGRMGTLLNNLRRLNVIGFLPELEMRLMNQPPRELD